MEVNLEKEKLKENNNELTKMNLLGLKPCLTIVIQQIKYI